MSQGPCRMSPDQLQSWQTFDAKLPGWGLRWVLVAEYAQHQGGLAEGYLQLRFGPAFGRQDLWDVESCAAKFDVPVSELVTIDEALWTWVEPRLRANRQWRELQSLDWADVKARLEAS